MTAPVTLETMTAPETPAPALSTPAAATPATDAILTAALAPDAEPTTTTPATESPATTEGEGVEGDVPAITEGAEGADAPEVFTVDIGLPNRGEGEPAKYTLELPNQEVADAIRHQANLASRVPKLQERADRHAHAAELVAYLDSDPVGGLATMAQVHPQAAQDFTALYIQSNPAVAAQVLQRMGYTVEAFEDRAELIESRAQLAQRDLKDRVAEGKQKHAAQSTEAAYVERAQEVLGSVGGPLVFTDPLDRKLFQTAGSDALTSLYLSNPRATEADMVAALQPIVQRFGTPRTTVKAAVKLPPRNSAGQFIDAATKDAKLQKLAGGSTTITPLRAEKVPANVTLESMFR